MHSMKKTLCTLATAFVAFYLMLNRVDDFNWDDLSGKNVLVTGASSGIGEQLAYTLATHGANVVITARREQQLRKVISRCQEISPNGKFFYVVADMGDMANTADVIDVAASRLGGIDMLILNHALILDFSNWVGTPDNLTAHDKIFEVNYRSFVYLASYALPFLEKSNGSIAAVGSLMGRIPTPWQVTYSASKFALDGFFSSLGWEHKRRGVNVSVTYCVLGRIETDRAASIIEHFAEDYDADTSVLDWLAPVSTVESTAASIVQATYARERELYYPSNLYLQAVLRLLWPGLVEKNDLNGKNVLVTGASTGVGEQIAYALATHGANVVITARREQQLRKVVSKCKELSPNGGQFHYITADMGNMTSTRDVINVAVSVLGGIDMLILNHALMRDLAAWKGTPDNLTDHDRVMDVNYRSFVYLTSSALPHLEKTNGTIAAVGSLSGRQPTPWALDYAASKFAMDGFFSSLRLELLRRGVNVSATYVALGRISTENSNKLVDRFFEEFKVDEAVRHRIPVPESAEAAAEAIIQATYSRERELYHPTNQQLFQRALLRVLWPALGEPPLNA